MLDVSPNNLWSEIEVAEEFRRKHLEYTKGLVEQYAGSGYREGWDADWSENHLYEFIRLTTGHVVFDNPRTRVKTRRPGVQSQVATAMQFALNRWVKDTELRKLLKRVYANQCFSYSIVQVAVEPAPWHDPRRPSMPYWPQAYMLEQDRFFFDPLCTWYGQARFAGHSWVRDKEDLLAEAEAHPDRGWIPDAIRSIPPSAGIESLSEREGSRRLEVDRGELVGYEVWIPERETEDPEKGFHGTIYTIAYAASSSGDNFAAYIREPRPFYGPRWGPYCLYGVYPVPGDPYPLSPFAATYSQMRELNDIVRASNRAISQYKRVVLYSAENPDLAMKIQKSSDMFGLPIRGFAKDQVEVIEMGGITEQHLKQQGQGLDRLDRSTGISQTHRGDVKSGSTATEIAVADAAKQDSISYIKQEFADATTKLLNSIGWYLYHDDRIEFPLGEEAAAAIEDPMTGMPMVEPWFRGGSHKDDSGLRYDDLELEIEPYSMTRMNEALARAQYTEMMNLVLAAAPVIPATPFYDWQMLFEKGGEVVNDREFGNFFNPELAGQMMAMNMMGGMGAPAPGMGSPPAPEEEQDQTKPGHMPGNVTGGKLAAERGKVGAGA